MSTQTCSGWPKWRRPWVVKQRQITTSCHPQYQNWCAQKKTTVISRCRAAGVVILVPCFLQVMRLVIHMSVFQKVKLLICRMGCLRGRLTHCLRDHSFGLRRGHAIRCLREGLTRTYADLSFADADIHMTRLLHSMMTGVLERAHMAILDWFWFALWCLIICDSVCISDILRQHRIRKWHGERSRWRSFAVDLTFRICSKGTNHLWHSFTGSEERFLI